MKRFRWHIVLAVLLAVVSAVTYYLQIVIFHKPEDTFFYLLQDFAFVPVQVLLVTLFISELLSRKSKQELQRKLNMVIGAFFSEVGTDLLRLFSRLDCGLAELRAAISFDINWVQRGIQPRRNDASRARV